MSAVHRPVPLDTVIVKTFDAKGNVNGERMIVGLFTSVAYNRSARDIPFLRRKVSAVLARAGFDPRSHDGKALINIIDTYPRDELIQIGEDDLLDIAMGILHLQERPRTALFVRRDPYQRFVSCLIFTPRDRYTTALRQRYQEILERAWGGTAAAFNVQLTEGAHARVHFIVATAPGEIPDPAIADIEQRLVDAGRSWADHLQDAVVEAKGEERGLALFRRYREAFPTSYAEATQPQGAIVDIERIEEVLETGRIGLNLYRPIEAGEHTVRFKLYHRATPVALSDVLPMLEHMGLKVIAEHPAEITPAAADTAVWIHDFEAESREGRPIAVGTVRQAFQEAFAQVWDGEMEDDGFNRLVMGAGLVWREVTVLRAYAKYLRQARFAFSQESMEATLAAHPAIARAIIELFQARFDPARGEGREEAVRAILSALEHALDEVSNIDEDRILRRFINLVRSTLRTSFWQREPENGGAKGYLSFKLDSRAIEDLPLPRPMVEIFVYSPRVEAVHLRGGRVARGGIRWSDRREDFRTEVLGLMKAQMVKNAVIVPVGSKGGFYVKRPPREASREAVQAEGIACYKTMMAGLLDITDNLAGRDVVPPPDVVRADGDDPYLVVAADKGTATFSDIANSVSLEHGFWLGDAFASGGSAGYDHKKMGITAKGAWEGVKRHFRELGRNIQEEDFTVVGVGDMSGDVFGNGMLLSPHIRLVGAFNHLHIFVDPAPDAAASLAERRRLFELARGSWDQYDQKVLSPGGAVFERRSKVLKPSAEVRRRFNIAVESVTPNELIAAMLRAEVDLLWFGGIGTYVKAADESHAEVGDKANDALRINARDLRAKVVGEGANLAVTQRGRIEYARGFAGGRINTDFIDNSAGVDCSDHEVNIKILLDSVVADGDMTGKQRNKLLGEMTDEVAALVLRDNYLQTQALSVAMAEAPELLDQQARFMRALEKTGRLNRPIEMLPDDEELTDRLGRRQGLTRPELAILLSYSKITLYDLLLESDLPDDPALAADLVAYFPTPLGKRHRAAIEAHRLRREIIATWVTNSIVNRTGPTFLAEMMDKTGMGPSDIARAYLIVRDSFDLRGLWKRIEELDTKVAADVQIQMMLATQRLVERATSWMLRHASDRLDIGRAIAHYRPGIQELDGLLDQALYADARTVIEKRAADMVAAGVPADLARSAALLNLTAAGTDIVRIAEVCGVPLAAAAPVYYEVGRRLGLAWLRDSARRMQAVNHWQKQATSAIVDDLYALQADLTQGVFEGAAGADKPIEAWIDKRRQPVERIDQLIAELKAMDTVDVSMLAVANRRLRGLMSG
jgi:glutamate dehydrogenase